MPPVVGSVFCRKEIFWISTKRDRRSPHPDRPQRSKDLYIIDGHHGRFGLFSHHPRIWALLFVFLPYHSHICWCCISLSMKPIHSASSGDGRSIPASAAAQFRNRSIAVVISPVSRSRLDRSLSISLCISSSNSTRTNNSGLQNLLKYSVFTYDSVHPVCIANSPSITCK